MIESYAVFEGGGAKGAAFAGALKAAEEANIRFVGFGGASAGAMVAFLSSLGMNADEIFTAMKERNFLSLLDEKQQKNTDAVKLFFNKLDSINRNIKAAELRLQRKGILKDGVDLYLKNITNLYTLKDKRLLLFVSPFTIFKFIRCANVLSKNKGFHRKQNIIEFLTYYSEIKLPVGLIKRTGNNKSLSYEDFYKFNKVDLRVIATDVKTGSVVEFSWEKTPETCIFESIAASCSYPIFFRPSYIDDQVLVDGGVSCNLPTFLFNGSRFKNLPVYAFDLRTEITPKKKSDQYSFFKYLGDLVHSAVDASNNIISDVVGGIAVPVSVPEKYDTLNFNLTNRDMEIIFNSGYGSAKKFLAEHHLAKGQSNAYTAYDEAKNLCGDFDYLLSMIRQQLESKLSNCSIKAWLYVSIDSKTSNILSVSNSSNNGIKIKNHTYPLSPLNVNKIDCVTSWLNEDTIWIYNAKKNVTRFCFPIKRFNNLDRNYNELVKCNGNQVIALLCIDINMFYQNCPLLYRWNYVMSSTPHSYAINSTYLDVINAYALTIRSVLIGQRTLFHEAKVLDKKR